MEGLKVISPKPTVFFGGFGEPLSHPGIVDMVARVKALGINSRTDHQRDTSNPGDVEPID